MSSFDLSYYVKNSETFRRWFLITAGLILAITGLAKLFTVTGDTTLLAVQDPIFRIEFRYLMFAVGVAELVIAFFCLFSMRKLLNIVMVAWIASGFLMYRVSIGMMDWERPCGCLGNLSDVLGMSPQVADGVATGLLGYLLVGSYGLLLLGISTPARAKGAITDVTERR